jgi:ATP-dependent exoDNAse (exonuclease V) beta subunit
LNGAEYQASVPVVENEVVYWTRANLAKQEKQVLTFNPSASVQTTSFISEKVILGGPIQLQGAPNMANLGTAIHGCIGLSFTDVGKPLAKAEVTRLLSAYKVEHSISSEELMKQISIFIDWIKQRWPNASATAELPVQALMPNGQFLNGRLDLILETADGWIIIDHKSSVRNQDEWSSLAQQYGSQLEAYASAVLLATNKPVLENWLYLPVSGGCIKLETLKSIRCE